jgi:hypothetical protein
VRARARRLRGVARCVSARWRRELWRRNAVVIISRRSRFFAADAMALPRCARRSNTVQIDLPSVALDQNDFRATVSGYLQARALSSSSRSSDCAMLRTARTFVVVVFLRARARTAPGGPLARRHCARRARGPRQRGGHLLRHLPRRSVRTALHQRIQGCVPWPPARCAACAWCLHTRRARWQRRHAATCVPRERSADACALLHIFVSYRSLLMGAPDPSVVTAMFATSAQLNRNARAVTPEAAAQQGARTPAPFFHACNAGLLGTSTMFLDTHTRCASACSRAAAGWRRNRHRRRRRRGDGRHRRQRHRRGHHTRHPWHRHARRAGARHLRGRLVSASCVRQHPWLMFIRAAGTCVLLDVQRSGASR